MMHLWVHLLDLPKLNLVYRKKNTRAVCTSSNHPVNLQANGNNLGAQDLISACYDSLCLALGVSHSRRQDFQRSGHYQIYNKTSGDWKPFG